MTSSVRIGTTRWLGVLTCISALLLFTPSETCGEEDSTTYQELVKRVRGGDLTMNFHSLRLSCIKSTNCQPRGSTSELADLNRASNNRDWGQVVEIAERLIDQGFVNAEAHASVVKAYTELHEPTKAKFHLDVTMALMHSILDNRDGKTKETAFEVISDREEYFTLTALGLPYSGAAVVADYSVTEGGHTYQRWEVRNPKTGQNQVVFFNTDAFSPKSRVGNR